MTTLADISSGNTGTADVFFLLAVIVAGLAAVAYLARAGAGELGRYAPSLVAAAVALAALGWLVL
jgi:hypothetical protein